MIRNSQRGFTMGEVLLVTSLFTFVSTGVMTLVNKKAGRNSGEQYYKQMVMDGRGTVEQIASELRLAGLPRNPDKQSLNFTNSNQVAASAFLVASGEQIVFEADLDHNGAVERIEYRLHGERLERSAVTKNADGSVPPSSYEVLAERVDNGGLPVFTFDGDLTGDKPVSPDPRQVRVLLLLRSPVRDRKSGRARTVGFEAIAQRNVIEPANEPSATPAAIEASSPEAAPADVADAGTSAPEPTVVPAAKLFTPIPVGLSVQPVENFQRVPFPRHLDIPALFPAGVVIATTAEAPATANEL